MKNLILLSTLLVSQAIANPHNNFAVHEEGPRVKQLLQKFEAPALNLKPQHVNPLGKHPKLIQKPQAQIPQPKPVVMQGGQKPQAQIPQPKPVVMQGRQKPQAQAPQPKPVVMQGRQKPQAQIPQPKPVVMQGGQKPQGQAPQPKPVVMQGGQKPQAQIPQPKPVVMQGRQKPQAQIPQPKPVVMQGGQKPQAQIPQPKPVVMQGGQKPQAQIPQPKPVVMQGGQKPQAQIPQPKPVVGQLIQKLQHPQGQVVQPKPVIQNLKAQAPQPKIVVGQLIQNIQQPKHQVAQPKPPVGKLAQEKFVNIPVHGFGIGRPQNALPKKLMDFNNPDAYKTIHQINFPHKIPDSTDIRHLLINAGLANNNILVDNSTKVTNILGQGGAYTKFLYKIKLPAHIATDHQEKKLIIKGVYNHTDPAHEAKNLIYLRQQKDILAFHQNNNFFAPKLGIDVLNYSYTTNNGAQECIAIMKKLSGKSVYSHLNQPRNIRYPMFQNVGRALGELHYYLARPQEKAMLHAYQFNNFETINHRDFHTGNILYSIKSQKVSFIDLERMADAHKERSPFWHDIHQMYNSIGFSNNMVHFLNGYVQAYPLALQNNLRYFLFSLFNL